MVWADDWPMSEYACTPRGAQIQPWVLALIRRSACHVRDGYAIAAQLYGCQFSSSCTRCFLTLPLKQPATPVFS